VQLIDAEGTMLNLTEPFDSWEVAYTWSDRITQEARRDRMVLVEAMLGAGFSNCREEFWHYSWGDSAWAVRVGEHECPYGLVEPPVSVEARFTGGRAGEIVREAADRWIVTPDIDGRVSVGAFWAADRRIELRVTGLHGFPLHTSTDREVWQPAPVANRDGNAILLLTPDTDRVWVASHPSEVPPIPPREGHRPKDESESA
jgi:hypothetical protein